MNDPLLASIVAVETALLTLLVVGIRFFVWPLYVNARDECMAIQARLDAVSRDRDGWRGVAERALVIAQMGRGVSRRAARLVTQVPD